MRQCGYEVLRYEKAHSAQEMIAELIRQRRINLVLDVGANLGQFAHGLRAASYRGRIVSFEPIASVHKQLSQAAEGDPEWMVSDRMAIGAADGSIEINIAANSESSSVLSMLPSHTEAVPQSKYVSTEQVPLRPLDKVCELSPTDRVLLKIDVQGFEREVLTGARAVLEKSQVVISELSLVALYGNQVLAREIWDLLAAHGFEPWSLEPCFRDPRDGRVLQLDGIFTRSGVD